MTKRKLAAILRESVFDVKKSTGLMKVILDVNDVSYWSNRAIECIIKSQDSDSIFANQQLTLAISLLALVKYENSENL